MNEQSATLPSALEIEKKISARVPSEQRARYYACMVGALSVHVSASSYLSSLETALKYTPLDEATQKDLLDRLAEYRKQVAA